MVYDWIVIGGGIHGTHMAIRLLNQSRASPKSLRIIDPNPHLLYAWQTRAASTKMKNLRSPAVHCLSVEPYSLMAFGGKKRKNRASNFVYPYDRPRLDFFNSHCKSLIESNGLAEFHVQDSVDSIDIVDEIVELQTRNQRTFHAKKIILAIGPAQQLNFPCWLRANEPKIKHLFALNFNWSEIPQISSVAIVGGGISAAQAALYAHSLGLDVYMLARHPLRKHQFDSDPGWLGPKYMAQFEREKDYRKRRNIIGKNRNKGSIPPDIFSRLKTLIHTGEIQFRESEIVEYEKTENSIDIDLGLNKNIRVDQVILATGFKQTRPGEDFLSNFIEKFELSVAQCGYPILSTDLAWHPLVHVTGALAELELGPTAKNIAGARTAADRIVSGTY